MGYGYIVSAVSGPHMLHAINLCRSMVKKVHFVLCPASSGFIFTPCEINAPDVFPEASLQHVMFCTASPWPPFQFVLLLLSCLWRLIQPFQTGAPAPFKCASHSNFALHCDATVVLFIAPAPFTEHAQQYQVDALHSWLQVDRRLLSVVLLVTEATAAAVASAHNISCVRMVATPNHLPNLDDMVKVARWGACKRRQEGIRALTHGDVQLLDPTSFQQSVTALKGFDGGPIFVAPRNMPFSPASNKTGAWLAAAGSRPMPRDGAVSGRAAPLPLPTFWMWNEYKKRKAPPLTGISVPPFWFDLPGHAPWLLDSAIETGRRHVIDLSSTLAVGHHSPRHNTPYLLADFEDWEGLKSSRNMSLHAVYLDQRMLYRPYHQTANSRQMGSGEGQRAGGGQPVAFQHTSGFGTLSEAPWETVACAGPPRVCLRIRASRRSHGAVQDQECLRRAAHCGMDPRNRTERIWDHIKRLPGVDKIPSTDAYIRAVQESWPFTLERQLLQRATAKKSVILGVGNFGYLDFLANFMCNLKKLDIENYVLATLDPDAYEWSILRGLPAFYWGGESFMKVC